jgi:hypothetical protein
MADIRVRGPPGSLSTSFDDGDGDGDGYVDNEQTMTNSIGDLNWLRVAKVRILPTAPTGLLMNQQSPNSPGFKDELASHQGRILGRIGNLESWLSVAKDKQPI